MVGGLTGGNLGSVANLEVSGGSVSGYFLVGQVIGYDRGGFGLPFGGFFGGP